MEELLFIHWNPNIEMFRIGDYPFRWYSMCWLVGLMLAYFVVRQLFKEQKIKDEQFEPLFIYSFLGILIGARLGHCIFYQPDYFLTSWKGFIEMLLPIYIDKYGSWHMVGYQGLASHGGTLGLMLALWLYVRHTGVGFWRVLDNIAIATGITACFIRLGNLMNSEIIGRVTELPWAFVFERIDQMPRHPSQLYESLAYGLLFCLMWFIYRRRPNVVGTGFCFGLALSYIFIFRFFIEFTKEVQEEFEQSMTFDMGQLLSLPFAAIGIWCMVKGWKKAKRL